VLLNLVGLVVVYWVVVNHLKEVVLKGSLVLLDEYLVAFHKIFSHSLKQPLIDIVPAIRRKC